MTKPKIFELKLDRLSLNVEFLEVSNVDLQEAYKYHKTKAVELSYLRELQNEMKQEVKFGAVEAKTKLLRKLIKELDEVLQDD